MTSPVTIGTSPFRRAAMLDALEEFATLYERRPFKNNVGGMKSPHMFLTWYALRTLHPNAIIESGVFKGQGTWCLQQACPTAKFYCIDPNSAGIQYRATNAIYYKQDFSALSWGVIDDKVDTVLFFDDHQHALERIARARTLGFRHLFFEDNYPTGQGDCYSLKQAFTDDGTDARYLREVLGVYEELPPVFTAEMTRWGTKWADIPTSEPLLTNVKQPYQRVFLDDATSFTWMCYARLK